MAPPLDDDDERYLLETKLKLVSTLGTNLFYLAMLLIVLLAIGQYFGKTMDMEKPVIFIGVVFICFIQQLFMLGKENKDDNQVAWWVELVAKLAGKK